MLHEARCWKYMSSIICLQSQLFEEACFVNLCLVDGFVHQYVRVHGHIHMMWIFFSLKEKNDMSASYVSCMMCFQFDGFLCDKTSKDFGKVHSWAKASWLQPNHENQMGVHRYFENKQDSELPRTRNIIFKFEISWCVVSIPESTTLTHEITNLITHEINSYFLQH